MKVSLLTESLQKKLPFLFHAISSRSQLPILLHFLLETRGDKLYVTATDLEIGIETTIPATIEEEGGVAVPARLFVELISSLPNGKVVLDTKGTTLDIATSKTKSDLMTIGKEEFPVLYEDKGVLIAQVNPEVFQKSISRVVFASSTDTTRPSLSGLLMQRKGSSFLLAATDGYRLSLQQNISNNTESKEEQTQSLLIPARVIREAMALKEDGDIQICVAKHNNQILFFQNETVLVGRLIEAEFPKYEKIIPSGFSTKVYFDREELQKAVKMTAIFARDAGNIIKFTLKEGLIIVSANTSSVGENMVEVEAKIDGEEKEIAFNARYLLDLFSNISDDEMILEMSGSLQPGVFKLVNDPSFLHLIMPIRTQG